MSANGIAKRIQKTRNAAGLTQSDLAQLAGLSKGFMCDVEAGKRNMSIETLMRIADVLKVPAHYLIVGGKQKTIRCPTCSGSGKVTIG